MVESLVGTFKSNTRCIVLLHINSIIVGYVFTISQLPTLVFSNHTVGGGLGFGFFQETPPGPSPGAIGYAFNAYTGWASGIGQEPLPQYRNFIFDRQNVSAVGNFSAYAVEVQNQINCTGMAANVTSSVDADSLSFFVGTDILGGDELAIRMVPKLAIWVQNFTNLSATSATARYMFLAINGSIDTGVTMRPPNGTKEAYPPSQGWTPYHGMSSLACDVTVNFVDSVVCVGTEEQCANETPQNVTFSSTSTLARPEDFAKIPLYMAVVPTLFGASIYGTQYMYQPGAYLPGSNFTLPTGFTSENGPDDIDHDEYTEEGLINYIQVGMGALSMVLIRTWISENVTLESELFTPRLSEWRTFILLAPLGFAILTVFFVAFASHWMYEANAVPVMRLSGVTEILRSGQAPDMQEAVAEHRSVKYGDRAMLSRVSINYGVLSNNFDGFGRPGTVSRFDEQQVALHEI